MQKRTRFLVMVTALSLAGGAGLAGAAVVENTEDDAPIAGDALVQATAAAVAHTGGGEVTETEMEDDEAFYEVEVRMPDGRQIDVHLDQTFKVVSEDVESADEDDEDDDDLDDDDLDDDDEDDDEDDNDLDDVNDDEDD